MSPSDATSFQLRFRSLYCHGRGFAFPCDAQGQVDEFRPDVMTCRVTVELKDRHRRQGQSFAVRLDVTVPDDELSVDRVHDEDVYVALREAFDDMKRQLQDSVRRVRGQVKPHPVPLHGEVVRFAGEGRQAKRVSVGRHASAPG